MSAQKSDQKRFLAHNHVDDGLGFVWDKVTQSTGEWSGFDLIGGHFRLEKSDQRERERFERISSTYIVWSKL